ncbi:hypothetical protein KEM55_007864 [Ascosphaera atra]|nr:hypothetical protein KEM55_007864 [Ascosphaera atra]
MGWEWGEMGWQASRSEKRRGGKHDGGRDEKDEKDELAIQNCGGELAGMAMATVTMRANGVADRFRRTDQGVDEEEDIVRDCFDGRTNGRLDGDGNGEAMAMDATATAAAKAI